MVIKEIGLRTADCGLWGFGPHNFIYVTDVSAEPYDVIFRRFYFGEGGSGFFGRSKHTHKHTHTPTHINIQTQTHTFDNILIMK